MERITKLWSDDRGQALPEYGLLVAAAAVIAVAAAVIFAAAARELFENVLNYINGESSPAT